MTLSKHISSGKILASIQAKSPGSSGDYRTLSSVQHRAVNPYSSNYSTQPIPKFRIPEDGSEPETSYQLIKDDLELDGKPSLNLASFVNTYIDPNAEKLAVENINKNLADNDEYPALISLHERCVSILSHLWNVPEGMTAVGTATTGSSEAIHLGGLAMKRRWQARQKAAGKPYDRPNIIMGANAQVALEKFARYFDVEPRIIPVCKESSYCLDVTKIKDELDENTIGIFVILGSTYTGHFEDVQGVSDILDQYERETGFDIPIHIDGASGAMVAPFVHPNHVWDFRLDRVKSINTSGHKFGLTTAGLGWVLWKDTKYLPENLVFILKYLGGDEKSFTLNFSRPGYPVIHQYYNFITLGRNGYRNVHNSSMVNARLLSNFLEATGYFECVSDIHRPKGQLVFDGSVQEVSSDADPESFNPGLPVVSFKFTEEFKAKYPDIPQEAVATLLRVKGYIIPNYPLPPSASGIEVLRVVVRYTLTVDILDRLMEDIVSVVERLVLAIEKVEQKDAIGDKSNRIRDAVLTLVTSPNIEHEEEVEWETPDNSMNETRRKARTVHTTFC
jgi:glutamate decarboxylase